MDTKMLKKKESIYEKKYIICKKLFIKYYNLKE